MKKKLIALLLAMSMLALTACGAKESAETTPEAETTTATEETAEEAGVSGDITYVSWMTKGEDDMLVNGFMDENPNVNVEIQTLDGTNYMEVLMPMILNGDTPDVFMVQPAQLADLAREGHIKALDDMTCIAKQTETVADSLTNMVTVDGKIYGYIMSGSVGCDYIFYNKVYFEKNGLAVPNSQEEFEALCAKIKELGDEALLVSAGDTWSVEASFRPHYYNVMNDLGEFDGTHGAQVSLLKGEIKPSDIYRTGFEKAAEYLEKGWISQAGLSMGWEAAAQYFVDGGAQLFAAGNQVPTCTPVTEGTGEEFELGAFPVPGTPDANGIMRDKVGIDLIMVMSANSENPDAAQALFEYISREDVLVAYSNSRGAYCFNAKSDVAPAMEPVYELLTDTSKYELIDASMSGMPSNWTPNLSQYAADVYSGVAVEDLMKKLDADFEAAMSSVDVDVYLSALEK